MRYKVTILWVFLLFLQTKVFSQCAGPVTYTVSPPPGPGGTYAPGQVVTYCITVSGYNQSAVNWFHGLGLVFGAGWDVNSLTVTSEASPASTGTPNVWGYFSNPIVGTATGNSYPPGFYFETGSGNTTGNYDGNPGDNYGDDCVSGNCVWTFCFTLTVDPNAASGTSLSLTATPTGDGQSGSWASGAGACNDPAATISTAVVGGAAATGTSATCFGMCNGTAKVRGSNGTPPYTYAWSTVPVQTTDSISGLCAGTYVCTITDAASATVTASYTVTQPPAIVAMVPDTAETACIDTGFLPVYLTNGVYPFTYSWSNGETVMPAVDLAPGTYTVTVTDSTMCTATASGTLAVSIGVNTLVMNAPSIINDSCFGLADGSVAVNASGGSMPYSYLWSNSQTTDTAINLAAGPYSVTLTDMAHCTATGSYSVAQPTALAITPTINNATCFDSLTGSIVANVSGGTPGYAYSWSNAETGPADTALGIGNYTLIVTDTNGCTVTQAYTITQPTALIIAQPVVQNIGCAGGNTGSISIQAQQGTPGYTYIWMQMSTGTLYYSQNINNLAYGLYYVLVTDAHGCNDTASYFIDSIPVLRYLDSVNNVSCNGGSDGAAKISVTSGTPPYTFAWDYNPPTTDSFYTNLSLGPVEVIVTDSNNCNAQIFLNITQPLPVSIQLVTDTNILCYGGNNGSITVQPAGGTPPYTYVWNNGDTTSTIDSLTSGTYIIVATDTNQCTGTASYSLTQPTAITINAPNINNIGCLGGDSGSITANVTNGTPNYTFNWSGGVPDTGQTINNLAPGTYSVTVTDANGCKDSSSYNITAIPVLTFSVSAINVSCFNGNNGSARVSITSGTPPYQFSWNNGPYGTDSTIVNLTAENLLINVTDGNECLTDTTINVSQPAPLEITQTSQTNVSCNGGANGEIVVHVTGGTPAYALNWNNQFIGADNTHLPAGTYTLIVLDNNDCADTAKYTITQPTPVVVNPIVKNAICFFGADGTIDANPSGGVAPYHFLWNNGETSQVADTLIRGSYDCKVTDANGCTLIFTDTIGQPAPMVISDSVTPVKCIGQKSGTASIWATGDTPPYYYNATNDNVNFIYSTNGVILGLDTGVYKIQVSDSNGCINLTYVDIPAAIPDEFYPPVADSTLCYGPDYNDGSVLVLDSTIQNGPYQYSIDNGVLQDSGYFQNLSAGPHTVIAVNANGCIDSIPVVVPEPLPVEAIVTPDTVTIPLGGSQPVLVTYLNATNPTFNWANTLGFSCTDCPNPVVSSYAAGTYVVTVSMINGTATCYGSTTLYVNILGHTKAFIPNVFTPNGDGIDDIFQIYGEDIQTASMKIFNRWGELVYSTTNSLTGWDGIYKGAMQTPGVFTYEAVITYLDNSQEKKSGTVTLLR